MITPQLSSHLRSFSLNIRGTLREYTRPVVMGIMNVTPDSFYAGSRCPSKDDYQALARKMIHDGADIIDIGGYSTRPGHSDVSEDEEIRRLTLGIEAVRRVSEDIPVSVDTFRAGVAREMLSHHSADIINDVSGASDAEMLPTVAELKAPYILTHNSTVGRSTLLADVVGDMAKKISEANLMGVNDLIVDPGFGFGKNMEQNYRLLGALSNLDVLHLPILVGLSRKSMITKLLDITAYEALNATTILNTLALDRGAAILRVHDVKEAKEAVNLYSFTKKPQ